MRPEDKVIILCKRTSELEDPGCAATRGNCWKCGAEVWIGPNSRRRMREFNAQIYCSVCGIVTSKDVSPGGAAIIGTENQLEELNKDVEKHGVSIIPLVKIDTDPDEYLRSRK